jgi:hypothetical protein
VGCRGPVLRVEVADRVPGAVAPTKQPSGSKGRGLLIVEKLSRRWGTVAAPDGKVVWFELWLPRTDGTGDGADDAFR